MQLTKKAEIKPHFSYFHIHFLLLCHILHLYCQLAEIPAE